MEPRGYTAGGQYAAAPPVRSPESARAIWRLLAGTNDEDSPLQISVLTFCKMKKGVRDMRKFLSILACSLIIVGCTPSEKDFIDMGESLVKDTLKDPDSAKFDSFFRDFGENSGYVCGYVNAKNSYGAYTGKKPYYVRIEVKDGKVNNHGPIIIINDQDQKKIDSYESICQRD